jgi:predicted AAA+ superfamily ATPase
MVLKNGKKLGFEIKFSESPKVTRSMHSVIENLNLDKLYLVYRGERNLMLDENIYALPAADISGQKF